MSATISAKEARTVSYLFALTAKGIHLDLRGVIGVGGGPLRTTECGAFQAVVEDVPMQEFNQKRLEQRLQNLAWVEEKARAHDRVELAISSQADVLPFRFCTLLGGSDDLEKLIAAQSSHFEIMLERVAGAMEWGVKVIRLPGCTGKNRSSSTPRAQGSGKGAAYLMRKKQELRGKEETQRETYMAASALLNDLAVIAREKVVLPPRQDQDRNLILNTSFLIDRRKEREFHERVRSLGEEGSALGLALEMTGPWSPYSFTS